MPTVARLQVEPVGIDHVRRAGDVAAHRHHMHRRRFAPARRRALHGAREAEEGRAVRQLRQLHADAARAWRRPGARPIAGRTRRSARRGSRRRRSACPHCRPGSTRRKKKGTPRAPSRCRVDRRCAGLLEADAEARGQRLHVVAQLARGGEVGRVGHQQRAGGVVQQADADQLPRPPAWRARRPPCAVSTASPRLQQHELEGHVEAAALARQRLRQVAGARASGS